MSTLLIAALAAYAVAAAGAVLLIATKRKGYERFALLLAAAGFGAHTFALGGVLWARGSEALFDLRVELSVLAWTLALCYFAALRRWGAQALGSFVLPLVALLTSAALVLPSRGAANSLNNLAATTDEATWLFPVHTLMLLCAYAAFCVLFAGSIMYLLQERELKAKTFGRVFHRLPSLATVEQINAHAVSLGWLLLTGGIVTGMLWSATLGRAIWHNDPKEILAAATWLLYTALLADRLARLWRGRRAAWIGILGFALVICTFLGARYLGGYHVFN